MAKKKSAPIAEPKRAAEEPVKTDKTLLLELAGKVAEMEGDLLRLAQLCGEVWGEPIASRAIEIAKKRQGAANG